ncbi:NUDIX hydrolase [Allostreptomyces psammosilenae]|uniref:8-oxo-dGTP pyrophosphatase MutT (NUDIX family) n=1 Tax=Allostreptomyces psammosilenae TaxID=1892865 RepID=A0A852ZPA0_9ACTN|nr:NUDIX domain-containing protein [Allostreptomyces psammosilenae]NYI04276.1 8-oxo-dGTP pyrophosphatase MutT (NUDIX family) [Allostreptomyces psammosilenae]
MSVHRSVVGVHLLLEREGRVLLGLRSGTGWRDGLWHVPSGHLERETVLAAAAREAREELGITIAEGDLALVHTVHHWVGERSRAGRIQLFFRVQRYTGEIVNAEPHKCAELRWWPLDALPENTVDYTVGALAAIKDGVPLTVAGFPPAAPGRAAG